MNMPYFIDTIKLLDGRYNLIDFHNNRVNNTINHFFGFDPQIDLNLLLPNPDKYKTGTYKCRLTYSNHIENIEITPYVIRTIKKLKIIDLDDPDFHMKYKSFNYDFKYRDRTPIDSFLKGIGDKSDVLFIKNGSLTDTSFSNIVLYEREKWITPATFLLNGVKRRYLLENNYIMEEKISLDSINRFMKISLINAMLDPGDIEIDIRDIEL